MEPHDIIEIAAPCLAFLGLLLLVVGANKQRPLFSFAVGSYTFCLFGVYVVMGYMGIGDFPFIYSVLGGTWLITTSLQFYLCRCHYRIRKCDNEYC